MNGHIRIQTWAKLAALVTLAPTFCACGGGEASPPAGFSGGGGAQSVAGGAASESIGGSAATGGVGSSGGGASTGAGMGGSTMGETAASGGSASGAGGAAANGGTTGGSATGGSTTNVGGASLGGGSVGGAAAAAGGSLAGGTSTGGTPTGGSSSGGANTGGGATGGGATGGTATGGTATATGGSATGGAGTGGNGGGAATGGDATGGNATGGTAAATGGVGTGGVLTGGTESGGSSSGGEGTGGNSSPVPAITKDAESLIALSGLTIVSYGGYLNGESFQQDGIVTSNGYQYAAFWNTNRHVVLARRRLPDAAWEKFEFTDYTNTADDAHNTISLGICPGDGTLHLSFDHHGNDLHYRRSVEGLTTTPEDATWDASSFSAVTSALEGSTTVALVTYPRFLTEPAGDKLLLANRIGESGAGDEFLWEYDASTHSWIALGRFIDGITDSVNAYLHGFAYTRGGTRLHMAWCWRETPDATTNHDLFYAFSDDHGRTWQNNAGDTIAATGTASITSSSAGAMVWEIGQNRGLINQEHMTVDSAGRVHVLLSHMPDVEADDADFTSARTKSEFFHYWRDVTGTWNRSSLGLGVIENFRGTLAVSSTSNVYAILPNLRIAAASAISGYTDWQLLDSVDSGRFFSDPLVDAARLETEDKLTVYYPEASSMNIWALDYTVQ